MSPIITYYMQACKQRGYIYQIVHFKFYERKTVILHHYTYMSFYCDVINEMSYKKKEVLVLSLVSCAKQIKRTNSLLSIQNVSEWKR